MALTPGTPLDVAQHQAEDLLAAGGLRSWPRTRPPSVLAQLVELFAGGTEPAPRAVVRVKTDAAPLHVGPGTGFVVVGAVERGRELAVWRQVGDWVFVSEWDGGPEVAGWVLATFLKALNVEAA